MVTTAKTINKEIVQHTCNQQQVSQPVALDVRDSEQAQPRSEQDRGQHSKKCEDSKEQNREDDQCAICLKIPEPSECASINGCKHKYCHDCITNWAQKRNCCPQCKAKFNLIEIKNEQGVVTDAKVIDDHVCNTCQKEYNLYENRVYCNRHSILNYDDYVLPSICNECAHQYEEKHHLCLFFCAECLDMFHGRYGHDYFRNQINKSNEIMNQLCFKKDQNEKMIEVLDRQLKEASQKLQKIMSEQDKGFFELRKQLIMQMEPKSKEQALLYRQNKNIEVEIDKIATKYKGFIELENTQIV